MALLYSTMIPLDTTARDFRLPGADDHQYSLRSFADKKVLVIVFMCNHCPYVKAVLGRLIDLQNANENRRVQFVAINSNDAVRYPDDSLENMKKIATQKKFSFPYLFDETQEVAKAYGAICTPDIFVYGEKRTLLYRGRIDDNWQNPKKVTQRDLQTAVDFILADKEVPGKQIPSMGCSIKWK